MTTFNIAILGECMIELQQQGDLLKRSFGGDTLNTAVYLSRLTANKGIKTSYVTALGTDSYSEEMIRQWQSSGIDTSMVLQIADKNPGLYCIETDDEGERTFQYWRSDAAAKFVFDQAESAALVEKLHGFDAIYLSGITLAILSPNGRQVLFDFLKSFQGKVIFDNNFRPRLWTSKEEAQKAYLATLAHTDIALLTFDDEQLLYGDTHTDECVARTMGAGVKELIIKQGSEQCLVNDNGQVTAVNPNRIDNVVDTTAAGDSFSGGYLAKRLTGGTPTESASAGHLMAGTVIQYKGAIISQDAMPDLAI